MPHLLQQQPPPPPPRFGIEIEFEAESTQILEIFRRLQLVIPTMVFDLDGLDCYVYENWRLTEDESCGYELVSPILTSVEEIQTISFVLQELERERKIIMSEKCGVHIHIDTFYYDLQQIKNIIETWEYAEQFFSRVVANYRINNLFCLSPIAQFDLDEANSIDELAYIYGSSRHFSLNATSLQDHGTLEFRLFEATSNLQKLQQWICLVRSFAVMATSMPIHLIHLDSLDPNELLELIIEHCVEDNYVYEAEPPAANNIIKTNLLIDNNSLSLCSII